VGTLYYYVVVINTNNSVNGTKTASTTSTRAAVTVTYSGVNVAFTGLPQDETINLTGTATASWTDNAPISFTVPNTLTVSAWYVDGLVVDGTDNTLSFTAQDYGPGVHVVTAQVNVAGKGYTKTARFTIVE
jgi:hypothetical protein